MTTSEDDYTDPKSPIAGPTVQEKSVSEIERETLEKLVGDGETKLSRLINYGHPATYIATADGMFLVTVQRVSRASAEGSHG